MGKPHKVLVLSRLTQYCHKAVNCGVSVAKKYGAQLYVMHLVSEPHALDQEALNAPDFGTDTRHKKYLSLRQEAREELDKILKRELDAGVQIEVIVKEGGGVDEVVKTVEERGIDLLIALAQPEGRIEHLLFGGDNDKLIRRMPCSILLVKKEPESVEW